MLSTKN